MDLGWYLVTPDPPPPAACTAVVKARGGLGQEGSIATSESMCSGAGEGVPTGLRPQADCEPAGPLSRPPNLIPLSSLFAFVYCLTDSPSFPPLPLLPAPAPICDLNSLPLPPLQRIPTGQFSDRRPPSSPGGLCGAQKSVRGGRGGRVWPRYTGLPQHPLLHTCLFLPFPLSVLGQLGEQEHEGLGFEAFLPLDEPPPGPRRKQAMFQEPEQSVPQPGFVRPAPGKGLLVRPVGLWWAHNSGDTRVRCLSGTQGLMIWLQDLPMVADI